MPASPTCLPPGFCCCCTLGQWTAEFGRVSIASMRGFNWLGRKLSSNTYSPYTHTHSHTDMCKHAIHCSQHVCEFCVEITQFLKPNANDEVVAVGYDCCVLLVCGLLFRLGIIDAYVHTYECVCRLILSNILPNSKV